MEQEGVAPTHTAVHDGVTPSSGFEVPTLTPTLSTSLHDHPPTVGGSAVGAGGGKRAREASPAKAPTVDEAKRPKVRRSIGVYLRGPSFRSLTTDADFFIGSRFGSRYGGGACVLLSIATQHAVLLPTHLSAAISLNWLLTFHFV
jgi:hypothetical protein